MHHAGGKLGIDLLADALPPDMAEKLMGRSPLLERAAA